jgi:hypothetical protein
MGRLGLPGIGVFGGGRSGFGAGISGGGGTLSLRVFAERFLYGHQLHSYVLPIVNFFKVF